MEKTSLAIWSKDELSKVATSDDLHISPLREGGKTYGALYVARVHGHNSRWYKSAMRQKAGRITAAGMTKDVPFESFHGEINNDERIAQNTRLVLISTR